MASWEQQQQQGCVQQDAVSEVSDCGTSQGSAYGDTREELAELAAELGLQVGELYEDRFRVDRRKLEHLLLGENENKQTADAFFQTIMKDTVTHIAWPSRLKIGAKSKKDPYVRIAGRPDDVKLAKERVVGMLDTRGTRVTMKMDVSYTDHSHIIGKGGLTIKKVMEETKCHIHFPDSNRNNAMEKSNQVSISGEVKGVEQARQRVRALMPLIFSFELPVVTATTSLPDVNSPDLKHIQEMYNVQVMFRTRPKLHSTLVVVKGCEWEVDKVKDATMLLINYLCKNLANQVQVQMSLEISPQHHSIVLGQHSINLKNIMAHTGVQIMSLDAGDPNIPALKKSNVNISGPIHNVFLARQQLLGSLPLVLMFDLPDDFNVDSEHVIRLTQRLDVLINIRPKPKQNNSSVTIKGIERNATNIYEARRKLLHLDEPRVVAQIPATYYIPESSRHNFLNDCMTNAGPFSSLYSFNGGYGMLPRFPLQSGLHHWGQYVAPVPHLQQLQVVTQQNPFASNLVSHVGPLSSGGYSSGYSSLFSSSQSLASENQDFNNGVYPLGGSSSGLSSPASPTTNTNSTNGGLLSTALSTSDNDSQQGKIDDVLQSPLTQLRNYDQKKVLAAQAMKGKPQLGETRVPTSAWSGCGFSLSTPPSLQRCRTQLFTAQNDKYNMWGSSSSSVPKLERTDVDGSTTTVACSNYLDSASSSVIGQLGGHMNNLATYLASLGLDKYTYLFASHEIDLDVFQTLTEPDLREIGVNTMGARRKMLIAIASTSDNDSQQGKIDDVLQSPLTQLRNYDQKKVLAAQAMKGKPQLGETRVPTSAWSGCGFSLSTPPSLQRCRTQLFTAQNDKYNMWGSSSSSVPKLERTDVDGSTTTVACSNYLDSAPSSVIGQLGGHMNNLATYLASLGLDKYTYLFASHEIDLDVFQTLTEPDLREIGVNTMGARRKMLIAIASTSDNDSQQGKIDDVLQSPLTQLRNYDQKKVLAAQAMKGKPQLGETRVPTSAWSGCGFSLSTPPSLQRCRTQLFTAQNDKYNMWGSSSSSVPKLERTDVDGSTTTVACSNYLDSAPSSVIGQLGGHMNNLATYLASLGLDKYTYLFASHEIDLDVFQTLTEPDLREIGVNTMGARRKMLIAIASTSDNDSQQGKIDDVLQSPLTQLRNYDQKKVLAAQAMKGKPQLGETRVPTSAWSGCGFSLSTPPSLQRCRTQLFTAQNDKYNMWGSSSSSVPKLERTDVDGSTTTVACSNYLDSAPSSVIGQLGGHMNNLATYLASLGLDKYTYLFASHEIDLDVFQTLTEPDLREIGVNTMGARRKMLIAIANLKKQAPQSFFSGSVAPGAERKTRQFDLIPVRSSNQYDCL